MNKYHSNPYKMFLSNWWRMKERKVTKWHKTSYRDTLVDSTVDDLCFVFQPTLMITANVPSAKKLIVHGPDLSSIPSQQPINEVGHTTTSYGMTSD